MPCVLVGLVNRPVCGVGHRIGIMLQRPPEIGHHAIEVVHRFYSWIGGTVEQHSAAAEERFNIVLHITEPLPDNI
jgi:hypothetical protein